MNARQYFQISRATMPLLAATTLAACGIDLESYGEPFFKLTRDAGAQDAATDQPADTAGRSAAGSAAPAQNAAGGGGSKSVDVDDPEDAGIGEDASAPHPIGGAGGHTAGAGGAADGVSGGAGGHTAGAGGAADGVSGGTGGGTSAAVSFNDLYAGIIATGCSCHNGGAGGLDLSTRNLAYASLVSVASSSCFGEQRVVPGNAEASVLFHSLSHTSMVFCDVPTMPRGSAQLSAAQLAQLEAWINNGARDD